MYPATIPSLGMTPERKTLKEAPNFAYISEITMLWSGQKKGTILL